MQEIPRPTRESSAAQGPEGTSHLGSPSIHPDAPTPGPLGAPGGGEGRFVLGILRWFRPADRDAALLRYGLALLVTALAWGLTVAFPGARTYYFLFVGAVALAAGYGGPLPGLLAVGLSCVLAWIAVFRAALAGQEAGTVSALYAGFVVICLVIWAMAAALNRTVQALRKLHLRFGGVVQISEDAILTIDEQQRVTMFNSGAERIFGYRAEQILGRPVSLLLPERYRHLHDSHVRSFARSGDALRTMNDRGVIYGLRAGGAEFPAEASISKFEAAGEKIMTVRLRDVSERRATEQRLRQMAAIVESSSDAIVSEDLNGLIISWNAGAEKMYGYAAAEAIGRDARMLLPPGAADEVSANLARVRDGVNATEETTRKCKEGKLIDVALTISPIRDQSGNIVAAATIARDITERKRLEQQLMQSQKMEAVGRLAGGVAHDFNNLLSIIVGYTYLVRTSSADGDPMRNAADQIMSAAEKATALTRQLLAFSRKQVLRPEVLDLNQVTSGIGKMLPRLLGEDIDVRILPGADLYHVKADPSQVEQVLMNLVVNARDAMPNGGKLTVETANAEFDETEARLHGIAPGSYVLLAVSDTGHGMDETTRSRIFEPFFTTKGEGKGTGLGLATVYGIVKQSNGHIWVYSEPGQGTSFKIYFRSTTEAMAPARIAATAEPTVCGNETVLLVEDEEKLRERVEHVLRDQGYKVLAAANGEQALQLFQAQKGGLDLLLTDVVLPGMRGPVLAEELLRRNPGLAVIYMSGYTDNALTHSGALPVGTAFLPKPFTPDVVLQRIRQALDEAKSQRRLKRRAS